MKGIILAGGSGTRLYPMTKIVSKQLQPIYDKPMIYYPLSILMLSGISEILIISTPRDIPHFQALLGDGDEYGMKLGYKVQEAPRGLSEAFILGEDFVGADDVCMILGDNLFHGDINFFKDAVQKQKDKTDRFRGRVFAYQVEDPRRYGVVEFDRKTDQVLSIEEKPEVPRSNYALPGLYIFDQTAARRAKNQRPSERGEIEIVDLMKSYLADDQLGVQVIGRGVSWFDTGTPESLLEAGNMIAAIEKRQGLKVACLHEIAARMGFVSLEKFAKVIECLPGSPYKNYLLKVYNELKEQHD
jgi:glucose-1-phosphate thymidylyltransferase